MKAACNAFHFRHPEVWDLFVQFALEKAKQGHRNFGAQAVLERVRWETSGGAAAPELKINNNHAPFYARRFNKEHPEISGGEFFRTRAQLSEAAPANESPQYQRSSNP